MSVLANGSRRRHGVLGFETPVAEPGPKRFD